MSFWFSDWSSRLFVSLMAHANWRIPCDIQRKVGMPLPGLTPIQFCSCPKPESLDFQRHMSWSFFYVKRVKVRGDYLFYWYWWNCWPSLFKLSFQYHCHVSHWFDRICKAKFTATKKKYNIGHRNVIYIIIFFYQRVHSYLISFIKIFDYFYDQFIHNLSILSFIKCLIVTCLIHV